MRLQTPVNIIQEFFIIDEENVIGRPVHTLQKTIPTVVDTVVQMRKVVIGLSTDAVSRRRGQNSTIMLARKDQSGLDLLKTKVLIFPVKDFAVSLNEMVSAFGNRRRISGFGVVFNLVLNVDGLDHGWDQSTLW